MKPIGNEKKKEKHLVNLYYFLFFWFKWAARFYNNWTSKEEASNVLRDNNIVSFLLIMRIFTRIVMRNLFFDFCLTLSKIPSFHLISWYGSFVERHSFRRISHPKPWRNCLSQNFHTRKLDEITVFYVVLGSRENIETNRNNWCLNEGTNTTVIRGTPCRNFLPTRYTVLLTFYLKPLNSSCMLGRNMGSRGHPAWEGIYSNKSFLELQSIFHHDPLRTLWFSTFPLVNGQLFSLLHRMLLLKIRQTYYPFHVTSTVLIYFWFPALREKCPNFWAFSSTKEVYSI